MTKADALAALCNVLQNYTFGLASSHFSGEFAPVLERYAVNIPGPAGVLRVNANDLGRALRDDATRVPIIQEYEAALIRMLVREAHEVALWYGAQTNQANKVTGATWFQFSRIVRNAVSHKQAGIMNQWPSDLAGQQVTWRSRTLEASMVGHPIPLTRGEAVQLFHDICEFVRDELA